MDYVMLGKTGLRVSVAGLGCGGFSRLGLGTGKTEAEAANVVRRAVDLGVTYFDTAAAYGTEAAVGMGLAGVPRDRVVVATKAHINTEKERTPVADVVASLDRSLRLLRMDYVDVFQLHGVGIEHYDYARDTVAPALERERAKGKFRHLGVTEVAARDHHAVMLRRAVEDRVWETAMLAFHMLHQWPRQAVLPRTQANGIGTLIMFAVRNIFAKPERVREALRDLAAKGQVPQTLAEAPDPLDFLIHESGVDVVLFGTGDMKHMEANVASLSKPPLPAADRQRLSELFGHLRGVGLVGARPAPKAAGAYVP
jgi:aryl-alcohol dehydrogenase-like predicted oxidoreductase